MKRLLLFSLIVSSFSINAQVAPFLTTTWNQTCYYNALVPTVGSGGACGRAYTGCNATAMAQICKYYAYPITGFGNHCNSLSPSECSDFSLANYNYSLMPNNVSSANDQVAQLMYDLGVAVDMDWSGTNSLSFFSSTVLKEHFGYSPRMFGTATFLFPTLADLIDGIKHELDNGRPVFAKGGGHFYLIDGYNSSNNFHMNFGWSGSHDGYYAINSVVNGAGTFTPSNFIFNIEPMNGDLETAKDTIYIGAAGTSTEALEFSSKFNWTMNSPNSWLIPNLTSGNAGYFNFSQGSTLNVSVNNNNTERIGYVFVENVNDVDTIVIVQAASTMQVNPYTVNFSHLGGTEPVSVSHDTWATWNVTATEPWISVSTSTGTGNDSFNIIASDNPSGSVRSGYVIVTGGVFTDSVHVTQNEDITSSINESDKTDIRLFPVPISNELHITGISPDSKPLVFNALGKEVNLNMHWSNTTLHLEFNDLPQGIYLIDINGFVHRVVNR